MQKITKNNNFHSFSSIFRVLDTIWGNIEKLSKSQQLIYSLNILNKKKMVSKIFSPNIHYKIQKYLKIIFLVISIHVWDLEILKNHQISALLLPAYFLKRKI